MIHSESKGRRSGMSIYTGQGDGGQTTLIDRSRVWKDDPRLAAVGDLDELGSWLGVIAAHLPPICRTARERIATAQRELLRAGGVVQSGGRMEPPRKDCGTPAFQPEAWLAETEAHLPPSGSFILPGGVPAAAFAHLARAVCRRAERGLAPVTRGAEGAAAERLREVSAQLNVLGDWLFVLARAINLSQGVSDDVQES
jgi:cob(I)alamin adenosyltransferase